jgi:hypothetical protein
MNTVFRSNFLKNHNIPLTHATNVEKHIEFENITMFKSIFKLHSITVCYASVYTLKTLLIYTKLSADHSGRTV